MAVLILQRKGRRLLAYFQAGFLWGRVGRSDVGRHAASSKPPARKCCRDEVHEPDPPMGMSEPRAGRLLFDRRAHAVAMQTGLYLAFAHPRLQSLTAAEKLFRPPPNVAICRNRVLLTCEYASRAIRNIVSISGSRVWFISDIVNSFSMSLVVRRPVILPGPGAARARNRQIGKRFDGHIFERRGSLDAPVRTVRQLEVGRLV